MSAGGPVFVTGATGFIGRQTVQRLADLGLSVRALVRQLGATDFPPSVEIIVGDLAKPKTYVKALDGAFAVVHAASADSLPAYFQMTTSLQRASAAASVQKFIHLSSIAVYGNPVDGIIREDTPPLPVSDRYARTKLALEEALRSKAGMQETTILRVGCVYGPGLGWWSHGLLRLMERSRLILVNDGSGIANLIHVHDVAQVISLALSRCNSSFDIYNVTDGNPVTWRQYFSELERVLGRDATVSMSAAEAREYSRLWLRPSLSRRAFAKLQGARFIRPLDDHSIKFYESRAIYSNGKAVASLGFRPSYNLQAPVCQECLTR
jgi:2-alkyl-3-oxoalkanoate reductase